MSSNIEARRRARVEIIDTLKSAGLLDGISLSATQLDNETRPCFWRGVVRNDKAKQKDAYATWFIPASEAHTRADNQTALREITIALDVFSKRSFDSEQAHKLLDAIEGAFTTNGFEVEMADERFEESTGLFHMPMTIYKLF